MNDYFAGWLASERQSDYLREVAGDERAALLRPERAAGRRPRIGLMAAVAVLPRLLARRPLHVHIARDAHPASHGR